jgi:hypothetical protein
MLQGMPISGKEKPPLLGPHESVLLLIVLEFTGPTLSVPRFVALFIRNIKIKG